MLIENKPLVTAFTGDTVVTRSNDDPSLFVRYPFKLTAFEDLKLNDNKHFVDVVGYGMAVGEPNIKKNSSQTVEFSLCSERKRQVTITMWGELGNKMIERKKSNSGIYHLILTSMNIKSYMNNVGLSSSSSTLLLDSDEIPTLKHFKSTLNAMHVHEYNEPITQETPIVHTLKELLDQCRYGKGKKQVVCFEDKIEILGVRTRSSWYLFTCQSGKCRKGLLRDDGHFKCTGCNMKVDYPRIRYRLELDVSDGNTSTIVVLFDEVAEQFVGRTAKSLVEEQSTNNSPDACAFLPAIEAHIKTKHVFQIKSLTYYHAGAYESFNCANIIGRATGTNVLNASTTGTLVSDVAGNSSSSSVMKRHSSVKTPAKVGERKTRRGCVVDSDSDSNEVVIKTAKRRLVMSSEVNDEPGCDDMGSEEHDKDVNVASVMTEHSPDKLTNVDRNGDTDGGNAKDVV